MSNGHPKAYRRIIPQLQALPRPVYGRFESLPHRTKTYRHSHPWVQLSYAITGVLEIHTDAGRFVAPPQRAVWIPAGVSHQVFSSPKTEMRSLYIDVGVARRETNSCSVIAVAPLLRELIDAFSALPVEYELAGAQGRLAQVLLDQLDDAPTIDLMLPLPRDHRLQQIYQTLFSQLDDQTTLAQWSDRLNVSEKTLSRLFLGETGFTFRAWRQRLRLFGALAGLERGDRVTDVALSVGYDSVSAFIAAFGELFGASPSAFLSRQP